METQEEDDVALLQVRWARLMGHLQQFFQKPPSMEGILFLVGVRELGAHPSQKFEKEEKQDLMHIAICAILAPAGYFELESQDQDGWPHWKEVRPLPFINIFSQEIFLKSHIIDYFAEIYDI